MGLISFVAVCCVFIVLPYALFLLQQVFLMPHFLDDKDQTPADTERPTARARSVRANLQHVLLLNVLHRLSP